MTGKRKFGNLEELAAALAATTEGKALKPLNTVVRDIVRVLGAEDAASVPVAQLRGLRRLYSADLDRRVTDGVVSQSTERVYKHVCSKLISFAATTMTRDPRWGPEAFGELTPAMWKLIDWLWDNTNRDTRLGVTRLLHHLDRSGLELSDLVADAAELMASFEAALRKDGRAASTWKQTYRCACRGLTMLQEAGLAEVFDVRPHTTDRKTQYGLGLDEIPQEEIRLALVRYATHASSQKGVFNLDWPHRPVAEATQTNTLRALQQFLGYLANVAGLDLGSMTVEQVFVPECVLDYGRFVSEEGKAQSEHFSAGAVSQMNRVIGFAKRHLSIEWSRRQEGVYGQATQKSKVETRRQVEDVVRRPHEWYRIVELAGRKAAVERNVHGRLGLLRLQAIIEFALVLAVRPDNILSMTFENLQKDERTGLWWATYEPEETKHRRKHSVPLPRWFNPILENYMKDVRPALLKGKASPYVFPSMRGNAVSDSVVGKSLARLDVEANGATPGQTVFLHSIRKTLTSEMMRRTPADSLFRASKLLGHTSPTTTEAHYADAARPLFHMDAQAEAILDRDELSQEHVDDLIQMFQQEDGELQAFNRAWTRRFDCSGDADEAAVAVEGA